MWLINVESLRLQNFVGRDIPHYAILSHTWDEEEITFDMMQELRTADDARAAEIRGMRGFRKIKGTCQLAVEYSLDWAWIDTCCIDKRSSAELSEAINSMFDWYGRAKICFIYFADLDPEWTEDLNDAFTKRWAKCRWFGRGWTLQELLAPLFVHFFDNHWSLFGTKKELCNRLSWITTIPTAVLQRKTPIGSYSIAARMSWAANRLTTREEDTAYCLFGLFGINLPLLYGEGQGAFRRLQVELLRISDDETLMARCSVDMNHSFGIFAKSPQEFAGFRNAVPEMASNGQHYLHGAARLRLTKEGLEMVGVPMLRHNRLMFRLRCRRDLFGPPLYVVLQPETAVDDWEEIKELTVHHWGVEASRSEPPTVGQSPIRMTLRDWRDFHGPARRLVVGASRNDEIHLDAAWDQATVRWHPKTSTIRIETLPAPSTDLLVPFRLVIEEESDTKKARKQCEFLLWTYYSIETRRGLSFVCTMCESSEGTMPDDQIHRLLEQCRLVDLDQVKIARLVFSLPPKMRGEVDVLDCGYYETYDPDYIEDGRFYVQTRRTSDTTPIFEIPPFDGLQSFIASLPARIADAQVQDRVQ